MTLGELIDLLAELPENALVVYDDGKDAPNEFCSYRGIYRDLSLEPGSTAPTVKTLLERAQEANGKTYKGYKGGDFTMGRNTPIWVAFYGDSTERGIIGHTFDADNNMLSLNTLLIPWEYR